MKRIYVVGALLASVGLAWVCYVLIGFGSDAPPKVFDPGTIDLSAEPPKLEGVTLPKVTFTDVTQEMGIDFVHVNGSFGKKLLPETMGSGVLFFDYNNDKYPDLLFINSCYWPGHEKGSPTMELYRNNGGKKFEKVTKQAGLAITMYGMGGCVGDFDNDGWTDVFITGIGENRLLRNVQGKFVDVTTKMGVGGAGGWDEAKKGDFLSHKKPLPFGSSATFLDYDGDGRLDLFVCNYVTWSPTIDLSQNFTLTGVGRAFGPPTNFAGSQCQLYRNVGGGFQDVSREAGVEVIEKFGVGKQASERAVGKSLGVIILDANEDGYPDVVVANDTVRNFFFENVPGPNGTRMYKEVGKRANVAYPSGKARGAMGIDWGEYLPGEEALLIANYANEPNTFLRLDNRRRVWFKEVALAEGIAGPSKSPLKFGAFFFDYDLDSRLDLLTVNGHLEPDISKVQAGQSFAQPAQIFWSTGAPKQRAYELMKSAQVGSDILKPMVGRGGAYADFDLDGDLDVVLTANGGPARLLRNNNEAGNKSIRLLLRGKGGNLNAIGARVVVELPDGRKLRRHIAGARGYLSQSEFPLTIGLGKAEKAEKIVITWPGPSGKKTVIENIQAGSQRTVSPE